ncbi:MAG: aminodeoxychorismate synthase component I [Clostridia bacterium]|nr:aminodeoxychorismate synthase component I [Clostridia bacterium]
MNTVIKELGNYKPISHIFKLFYKEKNAVFLDSSLENEIGRYSIIGINEYLTLILKDGHFFINGVESKNNFEEYLEEYILNEMEENLSSLPIVKGGIGYFSYDYGRSIEKISTRHDDTDNIPECIWNFYDNFIIEDLKEKKVYLIANGKTEHAEKSIKQLEEKIDSFLFAEEDNIKSHGEIEVKPNFEKNEYMNTIKKMKDYMIEGDIYIANMTQKFKVISNNTPYQFFTKLRKDNPSTFGGYFNYGSFQIVSASPERFMFMKDGIIHTRPIKGTRKRGETKKEDEQLKKELEDSNKDKSELLMIVDLERNDLNKVCEEHSVVVNQLFNVESYATVYHLVSDISGKIRQSYTVIDVIRASFPGGSITGAPKHRAMEIIDELEHGVRGLYTGSIGYISLDGNFDFNIAIRTAVYKDGYYYIGAGGGITCESELEFEYEETLQKAKALLEALK